MHRLLPALALFAASSVVAAELPQVPAGHPRVYVRPADLPELKAKLGQPQFAQAWEDVQASSEPLAKALVFLLTGDRTAGEAAVAVGLQQLQACTDARRPSQAMHWGAVIYDWCYDLLDDTKKQAFITEFERIAALHEPWYPARLTSMAVVGHTTEGWLLSGQLPAGLAIYDESPEMFTAAEQLFFGRFVEVRDFYYPAHRHHQGDSYVSRFFHDMKASWLFRRMGAGDVFSREQQFVPYQLIYNLRPDGQQLRSGDTYDDAGRSADKREIALLTGSYYQDPYLLWLADSDLFGRGGFSYRVLELLFRPSGVATRPLSELPAKKYFPMPMGEMVVRTGWTLGVDSPDALVHMRIGGTFFGNHQRKDFGTFQVYYRGPLALSTGVYEGVDSPYGSEHWLSWHHQTIAHNGLLVFDPSEPMEYFSNAANDGGQRWPKTGDHPPDLTTLLTKGYDYGRVTAHGVASGSLDFGYLAGDITQAYSPTKVTEVTRSMVALVTHQADAPAVLVVLDRVTATRPELKKTWLLHSIQEPVVEGRTITVVHDGATYDAKGHYGGKLVVESLLPEAASVTAIGGPGTEFWIESAQKSFAVTKSGAAEPGAWRVEVSPAHSSARDLFLHVLTVMPIAAMAGPKVDGLETADLVGASVLGKTVFFGKASSRLDAPVRFTLTTNQEVLVCDLAAGPWTVFRDGGPIAVRDVSAEAGTLDGPMDPGEYELRPGNHLPDAGMLSDPDAGTPADAGESSSWVVEAEAGCGCSPSGGAPSLLALACCLGFMARRSGSRPHI